MFRVVNLTQAGESTTLTPEELRKLSDRCLKIATWLNDALEQVDRRGVREEEREGYFNLMSLKSEMRAIGLFFSRKSMSLTVKATDLAEYRQEIEGSTQRLKNAIAQLNQSNATLGKLATGINFVVDVLETLKGGGLVSIAGALGRLDSLLS
ncbi:MAG: hypothetical protein ACFCAD_25225 [Pleurocapsa sp.]